MEESGQQVWFDPVVPGRDGRPFSIPAIIWAEGSLFIVDFRRWKGSLSFHTKTAQVKVKKNFLWWDYETTEERVIGLDTSKIVKRKDGNYGEDTFVSTMNNPVARPTAFLHALKNWLGERDSRWKRLKLHPVVAFIDDETKLGPVRSIESGIVMLADLPELVRDRRNDQFLGAPAPWISEALDTLPSWDRLVTRTVDVFQGRIIDSTLGIETDHGDDLLRIPEVEWIEVNREGILSERDELTIHLRDGSVKVAWCQRKSLQIDDGHGSVEHKLRNLSAVVVSFGASDLRLMHLPSRA